MNVFIRMSNCLTLYIFILTFCWSSTVSYLLFFLENVNLQNLTPGLKLSQISNEAPYSIYILQTVGQGLDFLPVRKHHFSQGNNQPYLVIYIPVKQPCHWNLKTLFSTYKMESSLTSKSRFGESSNNFINRPCIITHFLVNFAVLR